jgi:hypothetical protein
VKLSRFLIATGALAATMTASNEVAAQSLNADTSIAFESAWTSGYMGLGGGLVRAMPRHARKSTKTASAPSRPARKRYVHLRRRFYDANSPVVLVADTLDHTGLNIANLRRVGSR